MVGHIGATWRIRLNGVSAVAMRSYVKLERCSTLAARAYGLLPIAISPAGTGSDKASYSHYDIVGD